MQFSRPGMSLQRPLQDKPHDDDDDDDGMSLKIAQVMKNHWK